MSELPYRNPDLPVAQRVDDLLARMTLPEKVGQLMQLDGQRIYRDLVRDFHVGSLLHINGSDADAAQEAAAATRLGIPLLLADDGIHGHSFWAGATIFPTQLALACSWNPELLREVARITAVEMRATGLKWTFSPVLCLARDLRWGRINETFGEDPLMVGTLALAMIEGYQGEGLHDPDAVLATAKHYAGYSETLGGRDASEAELSRRKLRSTFLPPFERAARGGAMAFMTGYQAIDGVPSTASRWLLTEVLREEWGYVGSVQSDYFAIHEMSTRHRMTDKVEDTAVMALHAGVDVELPDGNAFALIPDLVRAGRIPMAEVDAAVSRVLRMKFEGGLFENPYADERTAEAKTATPAAVALAREAARKAVVLLKNDKGVLPLDGRRIKRLALLGTHARDTPLGGCSDEPKHVVSLLEGLTAEGRAQGFAVDYAEAVRITEQRSWTADEVKLIDPAVNARLIAEAVETAKRADVVVMVLGDNEQTSREAWAETHLGDRNSLDLVGQQNDLARAIFDLGKPTVVFLLNGRPLSINLLAERADAIIEGWYLGEQTGFAAADVLFGRANPGGKLPVSIARNAGQLPVFYNRKPTARRGYLFDEPTSPLYPFGFGLSYTTFEISAPRLADTRIGQGESVKVEVDVANTGGVAGDEVVQLYVRDVAASITRPVLELKHFKRVTLAPGARTTVTFDIKPADLSMWNLEMKRVVEPGDFEILVGPNSVDLKKVVLTVA